MSRRPDEVPEVPAADANLGRRNLWAVSATSFFTDVSSEMVLHLLPLYLSGVLGVRIDVIGWIEGIASSTASLTKVASGWWSDRIRRRKGLAVLGYGLSAVAKPFFAVAATWGQVATVRWVERVGKGVRTAPRDALLADTTAAHRRGFVFGLHRAADTAGAVVGLGVALAVVWILVGPGGALDGATFRAIVLWSLLPAFLAVAILALVAREPSLPAQRSQDEEPTDEAPQEETPPETSWRGLGRPFFTYLAVVALFDLGNSADAFLVLRAAERGLSVVQILAMLLTFNIVYALVSTPGGKLSDRIGRRRVLAVGWTIYGCVYLGLALAGTGTQVWALVAVYGVYHGLTQGTAKALVVDLVPAAGRGKALGLYAGVLGILDLPASVLAGVLWHGTGSWQGWGAPAPFFLGASLAFAATAILLLVRLGPSTR